MVVVGVVLVTVTSYLAVQIFESQRRQEQAICAIRSFAHDQGSNTPKSRAAREKLLKSLPLAARKLSIMNAKNVLRLAEEMKATKIHCPRD